MEDNQINGQKISKEAYCPNSFFLESLFVFIRIEIIWYALTVFRAKNSLFSIFLLTFALRNSRDCIQGERKPSDGTAEAPLPMGE